MNEELIYKKWFTDYTNPTYRELKLWMEDAESFEPGQDWDIIIGDEGRLTTLVRLANNDGPQREVIVHYLHVATANAFHHDRGRISEGIRLVHDSAFSDLLDWKRKALFLLETPKSFRKSEWFDYRYNL